MVEQDAGASTVTCLVGTKPLHHLVVDLRGELFGFAAEQGAAIAVQGASPNVRVILGISGLPDLADSAGG